MVSPLTSLKSVIKWFLDALFLGGIIDLLWKAGGNCSCLSELEVISKHSWEYKELRGLYSLETWWEGSFFAFFSCNKERNCLGNSFEEQKCILLNQISLDLSRLLELCSQGGKMKIHMTVLAVAGLLVFLMLGFWLIHILLGQRHFSPVTVKNLFFSKTRLP